MGNDEEWTSTGTEIQLTVWQTTDKQRRTSRRGVGHGRRRRRHNWQASGCRRTFKANQIKGLFVATMTRLECAGHPSQHRIAIGLSVYNISRNHFSFGDGDLWTERGNGTTTII